MGFKENDVVIATKPVPGTPVQSGDGGTIMMVLDANSGVYLVEFMSPEGESIAVTEVGEESLRWHPNSAPRT